MKKLIYLFLTFTFLTCLTHAQSNLIGTNRFGGNGFGTIYKYTAGDTSLAEVLKINGSHILHSKSLIKIGSFFYGIDYSGGGEGLGSLFKYNLTSKTFTNLHQFSRDSGATPFSSLLLASNGKLYGATSQGGHYNGGTLFEFDPNTGEYITILNCDSISGIGVNSDFIQASNGNLYITSTNQGSGGFGTILELDLNTMIVQNIYDFTSTVGPPNSVSEGVGLIESVSGKLLGFSPRGGLNNFGFIFEFELNTNTFTIKYNFDGINGNKPGAISKATSTQIIGSTYEGGSNNIGVLFEYDFISHTYTKKFDFTPLNGKNPCRKMIKLANGKFYGTTFKGGINDRGVLFEYNFTTNTFIKLYDFEEENFTYQNQLATDNIGNLYGSQSWQTLDSSYSYLFKYNLPTGNMAIDAYFGLNDGNDLPGGCVLASNGKYYAATNKGGNNNFTLFYCGAIIEYDYNSNSITKKLDLNDSIGYSSFSSLVYASNGKIYGTTSRGGAFNYGTLFEYDYTANTISKKHDFNPTSGVQWFTGGWLMEASNGKIYGTCQTGGPFGMGTFYEYDFVSNVFTTKAVFSDSLGSEPFGGIVQASNGNLYTTVSYGGPSGYGGIIEYNLITDSIIMKRDFLGTGVYASDGSLIEIAPNKLYGLSIGDGANGQGALYEYDCLTNQITILYDFTLATGRPTGSLLNASNGKLYGGTTETTATLGGLFEFDIATGVYSQKLNWNILETGWKTGNRLLEVGCIAPGILASGPISFCQGDSVTLTAFGSNSNFFQWNQNGIAIPGANSQNLTVKSPGKYSVSVTDTLCALQFTSNSVRVRVPCITPIDNQSKIAGPNEEEIYLHYNAGNQQIELYASEIPNDFYRIIIADATGRILLNENSSITGNTISRQINCFNFAKGLYVMNVIYGDNKVSLKFVKEE